MIPIAAAGAPRTFVIAFSTAIAAAFATGACGPAEPELQAPIDADTYVAVMAELADLERFPPLGSDEATRSEEADSARRDILERHGVTPDELLDFAEAVGAQPGLMVEVVDRIVEVSDSLAGRQTGAGRAADSAAAGAASDSVGDLQREFRDRDEVSDLVRDSGPASDSVAPRSTDSAAAQDSLPLRLRQRLRDMRERGAERLPSP